MVHFISVMRVKTGIQQEMVNPWIPAFAGMTNLTFDGEQI